MKNLLYLLALTLPVLSGLDGASVVKRIHKRSLDCKTHPPEPCTLAVNPPDARLSTGQDPYSVYACTAAANNVAGVAVYVVSVFFAHEGRLQLDVTSVRKVSGTTRFRLILMSHDAVDWDVRLDGQSSLEVVGVHLISLNSSISTVKLDNQQLSYNTEIKLSKEKDYYGFGRRKYEYRRLLDFVRRRGYGDISSFSGAVTGANWTLSVGLNYHCYRRFSAGHETYCEHKRFGFHGDPSSRQKEHFILCSRNATYQMKCNDGMRYSFHSRQCELETEVGNYAYPLEGVTEVDPCLRNEKCWTRWAFTYDGAWAECAGGERYISLTKYGLYVGVLTCANQTRYKLFLSDDKYGEFRDIGDGEGFGADHCEFIGGDGVGARTALDYQASPVKMGYMRKRWGEMPTEGLIGFGENLHEWTGYYYPKWYECGVSIPGNATEEELAMTILEKSDRAQEVKKGASVTLTCVPNYKEAEVTWYSGEHGFLVEENDRKVFSANRRNLTINNFGEDDVGPYHCVAAKEHLESSHLMMLSIYENVCGENDLEFKKFLHRDMTSLQQKNLFRVDYYDIGEEVSLSCKADRALYYKWYKNGKLIRNADSSTYTIPCFTNADTGDYRCKAYADNEKGECFRMQNIALNVKHCGKVRASGRIIGGTSARVGSVPWMVVLKEVNAGRFCGGVVLNRRWVATAAHCVNGTLFKKRLSRELRKENIRLEFGVYNEEQPRVSYQMQGAAEILSHPKYNPTTLDNDIALVKLDAPIELNANVTSICMGSPEFLQQEFLDAKNFLKQEEDGGWKTRGARGQVTGWGRSENGYASDELKTLALPITPCPNQVARDATIQPTRNMFCAGDTSGSDTCKGDSGGPFVVKYEGHNYLAGLVSWGSGDCSSGRTFFAKVPNYYDWIMKIISKFDKDECSSK